MHYLVCRIQNSARVHGKHRSSSRRSRQAAELASEILTRAGMVAERATRSFWPLWSILIAVLAALMLGLQDTLPGDCVGSARLRRRWSGALGGWRGARSSDGRRGAKRPNVWTVHCLVGRSPRISDIQAIGAGDAASEAVWSAHVAADGGTCEGREEPCSPDLRVSSRDPYALRYVALARLS
jgi:hypothetical protein